MGDLIALGERLQERSALRTDSGLPAFYFELGCPFSYLAAERVERMLGEVEWVPVCGSPVPRSGAPEAEERAAALRLPLVWPVRFPAGVPGVMRAAAYACEGGAGARFALAASRLAFCGGYDLDQPEVLSELAAAVGIPRSGCLEAARDACRDAALELAAQSLRRRGVLRLPAFRVAGRLFEGEPALVAAAALQREGRGPASVAHPA
jgi:2-hydroxychromene-2-carboxylate isomerase